MKGAYILCLAIIAVCAHQSQAFPAGEAPAAPSSEPASSAAGEAPAAPSAEPTSPAAGEAPAAPSSEPTSPAAGEAPAAPSAEPTSPAAGEAPAAPSSEPTSPAAGEAPAAPSAEPASTAASEAPAASPSEPAPRAAGEAPAALSPEPASSATGEAPAAPPSEQPTPAADEAPAAPSSEPASAAAEARRKRSVGLAPKSVRQGKHLGNRRHIDEMTIEAIEQWKVTLNHVSQFCRKEVAQAFTSAGISFPGVARPNVYRASGNCNDQIFEAFRKYFDHGAKPWERLVHNTFEMENPDLTFFLELYGESVGLDRKITPEEKGLYLDVEWQRDVFKILHEVTSYTPDECREETGLLFDVVVGESLDVGFEDGKKNFRVTEKCSEHSYIALQSFFFRLRELEALVEVKENLVEKSKLLQWIDAWKDPKTKLPGFSKRHPNVPSSQAESPDSPDPLDQTTLNIVLNQFEPYSSSPKLLHYPNIVNLPFYFTTEPTYLKHDKNVSPSFLPNFPDLKPLQVVPDQDRKLHRVILDHDPPHLITPPVPVIGPEDHLPLNQ